MRAIHLRTEYLDQPLGLGNRQPRFFWNCDAGQKGETQDGGEAAWTQSRCKAAGTQDGSKTEQTPGQRETAGDNNQEAALSEDNKETAAPDPRKAAGALMQGAYRITAEEVCPDGTLRAIWDSGKVASGRMTGIPYEGEALRSRERVRWSVILWDAEDVPGERVSSEFEMGLLGEADWKASWITGDYHPKKNLHYPVDYFRKKYRLSPVSPVVRVRLYASARGIYDVAIDGERLEDFCLAPGITDYWKRISYQTYDVTALLQTPAASHVIELRLADGWYRGSCAAYGVMDVYGVQTSVLAQLEVTHANGVVETIGTDQTWAWSNDGPLLFADLKDGEVVDARKHPSYHGTAVKIKAPTALLAAADNVPVHMKERLSPRILTSQTGKKVLDFGQNLAGWLTFSLQGKPGQKVVLTMGEILDEKGEVDLHGVQELRPVKGWNQLLLVKKLMGQKLSGKLEPTPQQKIVFICSGKEDHYRTAFSVFGFRYAQVETMELSGDPEPTGNRKTAAGDDGKTELLPGLLFSQIESIAVYSDMEETGDYHCSHEMVNQLVRNTRWSMKSNFLDIPTDCPTRERLGWTGDAQLFFCTGAYFMNTAPFFAKWIRDMEDAQYKNGLLPAVLPYEGVEMMYKATGTSVGWADAVYLIPYRYYLQYGDMTLLQHSWPMIRKYSDYLMAHTGMSERKAAKANPYNQYTYEKGVHLGEWLEPGEFRDKVYGAQAKHPEECTAYLYLAMVTIGRIAALLGEKAYARKLSEYAEGAKKAYDWLIVQKGLLDTDRQAKLVRPLALGLLDGENKKAAQARLRRAVENYHYCVGTGFLSTPFLLGVLSEAGYTETAYRMLKNEEKPGWLSEVKAGATTVWENWEGNLSQNHYSPGAVCAWLFAHSAGIQVAGERHFVIAPLPDPAGDSSNIQAEGSKAQQKNSAVPGVPGRDIMAGARHAAAPAAAPITYARARYHSIYGEVRSAWERDDDGSFRYTVEIPANTMAEIHLPDGRNESVGPGVHRW